MRFAALRDVRYPWTWAVFAVALAVAAAAAAAVAAWVLTRDGHASHETTPDAGP
jgi:histidinol-phosphate/aromatic aminotransferase/cobyric acid decarboxylase-like protein